MNITEKFSSNNNIMTWMKGVEAAEKDPQSQERCATTQSQENIAYLENDLKKVCFYLSSIKGIAQKYLNKIEQNEIAPAKNWTNTAKVQIDSSKKCIEVLLGKAKLEGYIPKWWIQSSNANILQIENSISKLKKKLERL